MNLTLSVSNAQDIGNILWRFASLKKIQILYVIQRQQTMEGPGHKTRWRLADVARRGRLLSRSSSFTCSEWGEYFINLLQRELFTETSESRPPA